MIPQMVHPYGKYWEQPDARYIRFRNGEAIITRQDFDKLADYSASDPTGVYVGKMWKRGYPYQVPRQKWFLCWYDVNAKPGYVTRREIQLRVIE